MIEHVIGKEKIKVEQICFESVLFSGEEWRFASFVNVKKTNSTLAGSISYRYQVKRSKDFWADLFYISHHNSPLFKNINRKECYFISKVTSIEEYISRLTFEEAKTVAIQRSKSVVKSYEVSVVNPILLCGLQFLTDDVKTCLVTVGQFSFEEKDFNELFEDLNRGILNVKSIT